MRYFLVNSSNATYPFGGFSGEVVFGGQPSDTETVTIGSTVYTFNTTIGGAFSVLIGASAGATATNLGYAINASGGTEGVEWGTGTTAHPDANADVANHPTLDAVHVVSDQALSVSEAATNVTWETIGGTVVTALAKYPGGDWTHQASRSAASGLIACRVVGVCAGWSFGGDVPITFSNHAGLEVGSTLIDSPNLTAGLLPLHFDTGAGVSAKQVGTSGDMVFVYYTAVGGVAQGPG